MGESFIVGDELNGLDFTAFNSVKPKSKKAIMLAYEQGKLEFCKFLFKMGLDPNNRIITPMLFACKSGNLELR